MLVHPYYVLEGRTGGCAGSPSRKRHWPGSCAKLPSPTAIFSFEQTTNRCPRNIPGLLEEFGQGKDPASYDRNVQTIARKWSHMPGYIV